MPLVPVYAVSYTRTRCLFSRRPIGLPQLALEDLSGRLARQRVAEFDVLWHLEIGKPLAQERSDSVGRELGIRFRLDKGAQPFAEFRVGDAEHGTIAHAVHSDQYVLDLCGIDVDSAGDHHVALAVAQEQIAVLVEVTDVADADEPVTAGVGPCLRPAVIVEIGHRGLAHVDFADFVGTAGTAIVAEDPDDAAFDGAADRA